MAIRRDILLKVIEENDCRSYDEIATFYAQKTQRNYVTISEVKQELHKIRTEYRNGLIDYTVPHVGGPFFTRKFYVDYPWQKATAINHNSNLYGDQNTTNQAIMQLKHQAKLKQNMIERGEFSQKEVILLRKQLAKEETAIEWLEDQRSATDEMLRNLKKAS